MSRLIKKTVALPQGITMQSAAGVLTFKGPKGEQKVPVLPLVEVAAEEGGVRVSIKDENKQTKANAGTMWALIRNAVEGVLNGYQKTLEIQGVGYRAAMEGKTLVLSLGYVNPVRYEPPTGVTIEVEKNLIKISGISKEYVGLAAAQIRMLKKPEPYKGKGIRYQGEVVRMKAGKKAATGAK